MKVEILGECGYEYALFGIGLSYGLTSKYTSRSCNCLYLMPIDVQTQLRKIAVKLAFKNGGENKFLRQISVWLDISAPRYWWEQMATYKIGTCFQSESTMHTLTKNKLDIEEFEILNMSGGYIDYFREYIDRINGLINVYKKEKDVSVAKNIWYTIITLLPQSFIQRRIVSLNYAVLQNIIDKRSNHKLFEWWYFCKYIMEHIEHPEFLYGTIEHPEFLWEEPSIAPIPSNEK